MTMLRRFVVAAGLLAASCAADDPPALDTDPSAPAITSDTLGACPPGGPDATTAPAGCLDADGRVLRP